MYLDFLLELQSHLSATDVFGQLQFELTVGQTNPLALSHSMLAPQVT